MSLTYILKSDTLDASACAADAPACAADVPACSVDAPLAPRTRPLVPRTRPLATRTRRLLSLGLTHIARSDRVRLDQTFLCLKNATERYMHESDQETKICTPIRSNIGSVRSNCKFYCVSQTESDRYRKNLNKSDRV